MKRRIIEILVIAARIAIGGIFIASSIPKIRQPYDFLASVYGYELVGPKLGLVTAMTLPWIELLAGICLIGGIFVTGALLLSIGLSAIFSFVLASALLRGLEISCGCFGSGDGAINYWTLSRAAALLLMSLAAYLYTILSRKNPVLERTT